MSSPPLYAASWGRGPDVVFLHGLGASSRYWENLADVGGGYRATAPDLLGFGRSPTPPDASYDVDCHLDALEERLPPRAVVVGHSTGAILAAALAVRRPEQVRALFLLGLPAYPDERAARESIGELGLLARLTVDNKAAARMICEVMCRFRPAALALAPFLVRDLPRAIASDAVRHSWPSYSRTLRRVVVEHRASDDLMAGTAPVTLVHGRRDRDAPLSFVRELAAHTTRGAPIDLRVLDGDHHLAVRKPAVVAQLLAEAIASAPA